jgi:hypothetical protein
MANGKCEMANFKWRSVFEAIYHFTFPVPHLTFFRQKATWREAGAMGNSNWGMANFKWQTFWGTIYHFTFPIPHLTLFFRLPTANFPIEVSVA